MAGTHPASPESDRVMLYSDLAGLITVDCMADVNCRYTVERMIHGLRESYNDVPNWKYGELLDGFGVGYKTKSYKIHTCQEWDDLLKDKEFNEASVPQVRLPKAPRVFPYDEQTSRLDLS